MTILKMGGADSRNEKVLKHILGIQPYYIQPYCTILTEQDWEIQEKEALAALLSPDQKTDFYRVIQRMKLDVDSILSLRSAQEFKDLYVAKARELERALWIRACVSGESGIKIN